jgi:TrmH family RNA methyltransferase
MSAESVSIVLVGTTHSGNIGATARAMANMGLSRLRLVCPRAEIDDEARARASGADALLDSASVHDSLAEAVSDAVFVLGTSARRRESPWRVMGPNEAAGALREASGPEGRSVAVVFGRESSGLSNRELDVCDGLVSIPVAESFPSINLAAAVALIAYEVRTVWATGEETARPNENQFAATVSEREYFFSHLEQVLEQVDFSRATGREKLMRKIRHLYMKAQPNSEELAILRGILTNIESKLRK